MSAIATVARATAARPACPPKKAEWTPHIWEGCDFCAWVRLLAAHR